MKKYRKRTSMFVLAALLIFCGIFVAACTSSPAKENGSSENSAESSDGSGSQSESEEETATGYAVAFVCDGHVTVTVFETQDMTSGGTVANTAYSRDGATGALLNDGNGQVNFLLTFDDGYELSAIDITGSYNNLKGSADTGTENGYRITKIASDLTVTVTSREEGAEETAAGYSVTFVCDEHVTVTVFETQDMTSGGTVTNTAYSRDSATGALLNDGSGQVNFLLTFEDGYELSNINIAGSYNNLKGSADTGTENGYRITKIASDLTVTVTSREESAEETATGYSVTFVCDEHVTVTVFETQDMTSGGTVANTAYSRDGATGALLNDGNGQVNFLLTFEEGYELSAIDITGSYNNLKGSADTGAENGYRITKIASDLTVTVTSKAASVEGSALTDTDASGNTDESAGTFITTDVVDGYSYDEETNTYTILSAGTYSCSGELEEGQLVVSAAEDAAVVLEFNGCTISNSSLSPVYILCADSVDISAKSGTQNYIYDDRPLSTAETETDGTAAVYAECDLTLKGKGELTVVSEYNNGIHTKDDLEIKNLTLSVTAVNNAIKGNDSITFENATVTAISTGGDALKTTSTDLNKNSVQRGIVTISSGTVNLYAACDGIDSASDVLISGGTVNIFTDKYSEYSSDVMVKSESNIYLRLTSTVYKYGYSYSAYFYNSDGSYAWRNLTFYQQVAATKQPGGGPGGGNQNGTTYYYYSVELLSGYTSVKFYAYSSSQTQGQSDSYTAVSSDSTTIPSSSDTYVVSSISSSSKKISTSGWTSYQSLSGNTGLDYSCKGIKAGNQITITGGTVTIEARDDGIHANFDEVLESTGANGLGNIVISGGTITITSDGNDGDGIHADQDLYISVGTVEILASYEGLEANRIYLFDNCHVNVSASDDGLNANSKGAHAAYIEISGGYLEATVSSGDTDTMDSNGTILISGGFVFLKNGNTNGQSMTGGTIDSDGTVSVTGGTLISAGCIGTSVSGAKSSTTTTLSSGAYEIKDSSGNTIAAFTLTTSYKAYMFWSDAFVKGQTYTVYKDGATSFSFTF